MASPEVQWQVAALTQSVAGYRQPAGVALVLMHPLSPTHTHTNTLWKSVRVKTLLGMVITACELVRATMRGEGACSNICLFVCVCVCVGMLCSHVCVATHRTFLRLACL